MTRREQREAYAEAELESSGLVGEALLIAEAAIGSVIDELESDDDFERCVADCIQGGLE